MAEKTDLSTSIKSVLGVIDKQAGDPKNRVESEI